jgi:1-acyl-sn-glycerol-3-phosphate acyltransferase
MNRLLTYLHGVIYLGFTAITCVLYLPALLLPPKKLIAFLNPFYYQVHDTIDPLFGVKSRIEGWENLPDEPCLIALQHQTGWETMRLPHWFRSPAIIMKKELFRLPFWGWYAMGTDMIPIDRSKGSDAVPAMLADAAKKIADGRDIVIFPQGTRTPPGVKRDYKYGIAKLYEHLNVPVVPVALNSGLFTTKMGLFKKRGTITVRMMRPIQPGLSGTALMTQLQSMIEDESDKILAQEGFVFPPQPAEAAVSA